jgi:hypothetical protein
VTIYETFALNNNAISNYDRIIKIRYILTIFYKGGILANKGGFSWKRLTGVTRVKQNISRKTGIPMTKSGRQRKVGAAMTKGCGCSTFMILLGLLGITVVVILII